MTRLVRSRFLIEALSRQRVSSGHSAGRSQSPLVSATCAWKRNGKRRDVAGRRAQLRRPVGVVPIVTGATPPCRASYLTLLPLRRMDAY